MKFQKVSLISAAAVLASLVSAGAYTQPAPHIPTPVGNYDGHAFYVGGSISGLGGYVRNQANTLATATVTSNLNGASTSTAVTKTATYADYSSTVNSFKFGGEAHLGAYFGVAEGYGVSIEAFGVTRTSFNPTSTITVQSGAANSATDLNSQSGTTSAAPNADLVALGVSAQPQNIGYGVRIMPTVMLSEQFGMYASVGYGSQKWQGTITNSEFFQVANQYSAAVASGADYQVGTTGAAGTTLSSTLSGVNYGFGSVFNIDETVSVYSSVEVQTFGSYYPSDSGAVIAAGTATANGSTSGSITATTAITNTGTPAAPTTLSFQLNTYAIGIDYAFA